MNFKDYVEYRPPQVDNGKNYLQNKSMRIISTNLSRLVVIDDTQNNLSSLHRFGADC